MFRIKLKALREKEHLSQAKLAKLLGVSQSTVGMWESGVNYPEYNNLKKIAETFDVQIGYLTDDAQTKAAVDQLAENINIARNGRTPEEARIYNELINNERFRNFASGILDLDEEDLEALEDYGRYLKERKKGQK